MKRDELDQLIVLHKLKNVPLILRHRTMGYYVIYLKSLRNGYSKCLKFVKTESGMSCVVGDTYISNEQLNRYKPSSVIFPEAIEYALGRADYIADPNFI